jgi:hypothetical protein
MGTLSGQNRVSVLPPQTASGGGPCSSTYREGIRSCPTSSCRYTGSELRVEVIVSVAHHLEEKREGNRNRESDVGATVRSAPNIQPLPSGWPSCSKKRMSSDIYRASVGSCSLLLGRFCPADPSARPLCAFPVFVAITHLGVGVHEASLAQSPRSYGPRTGRRSWCRKHAGRSEGESKKRATESKAV